MFWLANSFERKCSYHPQRESPRFTRAGADPFQREKTIAVKSHSSLSKMKFSTLHFGKFKRSDEETVEISARLYECPSEYDYWLAIFDVVHKNRKTLHMTSFIPKTVASSVDAAKGMLKGDALEQVKSKLLEAGSGGPAILTLEISKTMDPVA
jgi:hypothetical protein